MDKIVVLNGMPASGKTTLSIVLADKMMKNNKQIMLIHGDRFAHVICGCTYTTCEMDMKYRNMISVMENLVQLKGILIVDDFFKRREDYKKIVSFARKHHIKLHMIHIICDLNERIIRDELRGIESRLGKNKLSFYNNAYSDVIAPSEYDRMFDTTNLGINEIINRMEAYIVDG